MSERTHSQVTEGRVPSRRFVYMAAGTVALLLVAVGLVQVFRAPPAYPDSSTGRSSVAGADDPAKKPLARVNKDLITWDVVAAECMARHGSEVLENIINRTIIQQACAASNIEVTKQDVDEEIARIAKKFNLAVDQWLQMLQAERNITPGHYRRDIIWPMIALRKLAGESVQISKEELQKAFLRNYGPRVKARAIVLDNQRRAQEVWERLQKYPQEFSRFAREYSVDPGSRSLDGAVPPIRMYAGSPEVEQAAFKLREGEISAIIQVTAPVQQFVILMCEGRTEQIVTDIKEVESILRQELHEEKTQLSVARTFDDLKKRARVDNYVTNTSTSTGAKGPSTGQAGVPSATSGVRPAGATTTTPGNSNATPAFRPSTTPPNFPANRPTGSSAPTGTTRAPTGTVPR